jgi:hypothetical protein
VGVSQQLELVAASESVLDTQLVERLRLVGAWQTGEREGARPLNGVLLEAAMWLIIAAGIWIGAIAYAVRA